MGACCYGGSERERAQRSTVQQQKSRPRANGRRSGRPGQPHSDDGKVNPSPKKAQGRENHDRRRAPVSTEINHDAGKKQEGNIRIGSWNLKCFSAEKASNDGYCEVLCMAILENG